MLLIAGDLGTAPDAADAITAADAPADAAGAAAGSTSWSSVSRHPLRT